MRWRKAGKLRSSPVHARLWSEVDFEKPNGGPNLSFSLSSVLSLHSSSEACLRCHSVAQTYLPLEETQAPKSALSPLLTDSEPAGPPPAGGEKRRPGLGGAEGRRWLRRRRSPLRPDGVKVCPGESVPEAVADHVKYFQVRGEQTSKPPGSEMELRRGFIAFVVSHFH